MSTGLGLRIKKRRTELGMSQEELAKRLHLTSKSTICKVERGNDNLTTDTVAKYASALNCTPGYLMGWDDFVDDVKHGQVDLDEMSHAIKMYELYKNSNPKVQEMVQYLLEEGNSQGANPQD